MRTALDLHDLGVKLYRQRMQREHPHASEVEIDGIVRAWLAAPPLPGRVRLRTSESVHGHPG
ncbi:hypothetical protein GCM10009788_51350 [Nocardioides humi]|uniref:Uncharacterized protein n=2 Tax=Nocardioides humi TaxID=449461 RepID=A0ABN2BLL2_9ACTN